MNAIQTRAATACPLDLCCSFQFSRPLAAYAFVVLLVLVSLGLKVQAQGTVNFSTRVTGTVVARVYGPEPANLDKTGNTASETPAGVQTYASALLTGAGFSAQLFGGPPGSLEAALLPIGNPSTFRTGATLGGTPAPQSQLVVPFIPAGGSGTFQVRAWDNSGGTFLSFEDAITKGKSAPFSVSGLGDGVSTLPADLANVRSFCLRVVLEVPTIIAQLQSQPVVVGSNVTFNGTATGAAILYYQWRKNGSPLSGATASVLTLNSVTLGDAGSYDLVVTNDFGRATSSNAVLQVLPPNAPSISVNGQLAVGTVTSSTPATVAIASGFPGGQVFYTLDDTPPTTNSTLYTGQFALINDATVQAMNLNADMQSIAYAPTVQVQVQPTPVYSLQTTVNGSGSISVNPPTGPYPSNSVVTLTATGHPQWRFDHWAGDLSGSTNPATLTMNGPSNVQAVFVPAYGTVNFQQRITGVFVNRVHMPEADYSFFPKFGNTTNDTPAGTQTYTGGLVSGSGWTAQLWAAPGADQPEGALRPAYPITTFRTGATLSGTVAPVTVTFTNVPADYPAATVQIRVWPSSSWWPYGTVGDAFGKSPLFNVEAIGGGTNPPANLINLRSFSLVQNLLDTGVKPLIYVQPQHQTASLGGSVTFTAQTSLPANKPVYWRFNGSNIVSGWASMNPVTNAFAFPMLPNAGGTLIQLPSTDFFFGFPETNHLQLTNVQVSQAGIYSLVVSNLCCFFPGMESFFTVSSNAVLTVGIPETLTVSGNGSSQVVLNWDGVFFLQSATNINGPFADLPGPIVFSPYTNTDFAGQRFFRLRN